jgi:plasmid stabilization system protein ParE
MHKLQYSELAVQDLFNIFENIAKDKPNSAVDYISKLEEYIELLENNPNMGVDCKIKNINQNCQILIYEKYLIFYRVKESIVLIGRILHSSVNYQKTIRKFS